MNRIHVSVCFLIIVALCALTLSPLQAAYTLSTIPRVDAHCHLSSLELMDDYLEMRGILKDKYNINLEVFIDLQDFELEREPLKPGLEEEGIDYLKEAEKRYKGRFLSCIADYRIVDGLAFAPQELAQWQASGIVGYKIWVGVSPLVDHPANDPTFNKMEQLGMVGAAVHISQPYPRNCKVLYDFWEAINAWERVLDRHPDLIVVNAHMMNLFYSDEQLEYLEYFLETYPNVSVDLSARFQDLHALDRDKTRAFFIEYADRILFGTDCADEPGGEGGEGGGHQATAERYTRCFRLLETDETVQGGFFGKREMRGLALPIDVLEKIYFRNAVRIYPRVGDVLKELGYDLD
jgi:predicted TIM-barrel fold metal-dependent hydrolase